MRRSKTKKVREQIVVRTLTDFDLEIFKKEEQALLKHLAGQLYKIYRNELTTTKTYLYAKGTIPVLLVAHTDTVHRTLPTTILYDKEKQMLWSPQGLGADDRAGVLGIMELVYRGHRPHILFVTGEEVGCIGAKAVIANKQLVEAIEDVKMVIELDRKNGNDAVFYDCDNEKFTNYIESFGFKESFGSFSDISVLCPAIGIAGVNLSTGYYDQHTKQEYLDLNLLWKTLHRIENIFKNLPAKQFKYVAAKYISSTTNQSAYGYYSKYYKQDYSTHYPQSFRNTKPFADSETDLTGYDDKTIEGIWVDSKETENTKSQTTLTVFEKFTLLTDIDLRYYADFYGGTVNEWRTYFMRNRDKFKADLEDYIDMLVESYACDQEVIGMAKE